MSETNNPTTSDESVRTDKRDELTLADPLVESSLVHGAPVHIPGMALETKADRENRLMVEAERENYADTRVEDPRDLMATDTRHPRANLATRSNIVPAGPGSAGDEPALDHPGLSAREQVDLTPESRDGVKVLEEQDHS